jgi:cysteinyl-tRNA synthetase
VLLLLTLRFEAEYFADMKTLGIKDPDVLVRVTEYVPYIIEYVQQIIERGYAYVFVVLGFEYLAMNPKGAFILILLSFTTPKDMTMES